MWHKFINFRFFYSIKNFKNRAIIRVLWACLSLLSLFPLPIEVDGRRNDSLTVDGTHIKMNSNYIF